MLRTVLVALTALVVLAAPALARAGGSKYAPE